MLNLDKARIYKDSNIVKIIQELLKHVAILKSDKGNSIVLFNIRNYINSVDHLFKDPKKFQILHTNPTITRMKSLQGYLRTQLQKSEIAKKCQSTWSSKNL